MTYNVQVTYTPRSRCWDRPVYHSHVEVEAETETEAKLVALQMVGSTHEGFMLLEATILSSKVPAPRP